MAREGSLNTTAATRPSADETSEFAESVINTVREPLISLDKELRVVMVSRSFYDFFKVKPEDTLGQLIYDLGNKQWDIPRLRELLETILPQQTTFDDYEVEHEFATIGRRTMLLNARQIEREMGKERIILLAIEDITERKEIEAGLEETRKELAVIKRSADEALEFAESVINTVREPLISLDQDLRVVTVSRSFYNFFQVNPEDTVGRLIYDLGDKQWDIPQLRELLETILPQRTTFDDYEVEHEFAGVGRRTMLLNARQIQRGLGKERIILLAIEDVTERKRAERILRESETMLKNMGATAKIGAWEFDTATMEQAWTEEVYNIHEAELAYIPIVGEGMEFYAPWAKPIISQAVRRAIEFGEPFDLELEIITAKGNSRWIRVIGRGDRENGKILRVSGTLQDVTERKNLERSHERLAAIVESADAAIIGRELDGTIVSWNSGAESVYGYTAEDVLGKSISILMPDGHADDDAELLERTSHGERIKNHETLRKRKDGEAVDVSLTISAIKDESGAVIGASTIAQDITERKKMEAGLAETRKELEAFAYSVSHDLRAPLRGIDGWSLALLEDYKDELGEQGREYIDLVRSETQIMGRLIDDLLTFSRQSRAEMNQERLDMTAMAHAIIARLRQQNPALHADFVVQPGLAARGDPGLIEIALKNLLDNAAKFSTGSSRATIEFGQIDIEGRKAFFVRDNGVGFDMAYSNKLFGVFQRLHKSSDFPGTGIGLASVQRIISRHGGRIWAEAKVGQGATFYFTLREAS